MATTSNHIKSMRFYVKMLLLGIMAIYIMGCSNAQSKEATPLTEQEQQQIEKLSNRLIKSINDYDFSVINNSWDNEAFKSRVANITRTQKSVFDHIFEKKLKFQIKAGNLSIIYQVNDYQGAATFLALEHFTDHSELTLLLTFPEQYNFFKYRIEIVNKRPVIVDFYGFKDNLWYSEKVVNMLRVNAEYDAYSEERHLANQAYQDYNQALSHGDTIEALKALNNVPETHQLGNELSIMKLELAMSLSDTLYAGALANEYERNQSTYMKYLYYWFTDTTRLNEVYELLEIEIGGSVSLDSLWNGEKVWN